MKRRKMKTLKDIPKGLLQYVKEEDIDKYNQRYEIHVNKCKDKNTTPSNKEFFFYNCILNQYKSKYEKEQTEKRRKESDQFAKKWKGVRSPKTLDEKLRTDLNFSTLFSQRYGNPDSPGWNHNRIEVRRAGEWKKPKNGVTETITDNKINNPHIVSSNPRERFEKTSAPKKNSET